MCGGGGGGGGRGGTGEGGWGARWPSGKVSWPPLEREIRGSTPVFRCDNSEHRYFGG